MSDKIKNYDINIYKLDIVPHNPYYWFFGDTQAVALVANGDGASLYISFPTLDHVV